MKSVQRAIPLLALLPLAAANATTSTTAGFSAILTRLDAQTGEKSFSERLPGANVYASPVAADGRVYVFDRDGAAVVLEKGAAFKVLATNQLDDGFDASPALVGAVRGKKHLYRIAETAAR